MNSITRSLRLVLGLVALTSHDVSSMEPNNNVIVNSMDEGRAPLHASVEKGEFYEFGGYLYWQLEFLTTEEVKLHASPTKEESLLAIQIVGRIASGGSSTLCNIPEKCQLVMISASAHGYSLRTTSGGKLTVKMNDSRMSISGTAILRFARPNSFDVGGQDTEQLILKDIALEPGRNLIDVWTNELIPEAASSQVQSWIDEVAEAESIPHD
jgi:hypothetical protein